MVICLGRGADLHMVQLMPLPVTVSCFSKIQIGFTFLVAAHLGSPRKGPLKGVCVCVCIINIITVTPSLMLNYAASLEVCSQYQISHRRVQ